MRYRFFSALLLGLWVPGLSAAELSWERTTDFDQMFLQDVRAGKESLVLKDYGPIVRRYDRNSHPAIGLKVWKGEKGEKTDVPTSFWHDPETDEIYVSMGGGSGFTILDPWKEHSVTYRNKGIWNTTDSAEGELLREDWTFAPYRSPDPGLLFDLTIYFALRRAGTRDIVVTTNAAGMQLIHTGETTTYSDDVLDTDLWWLRFHGLFSNLYEDDDGNLFTDLTHGRGFIMVHADMRTVTFYSSNGASVYSGPNSQTHFFNPSAIMANWFRPLFKGRNGDLYVGGFDESPRPPNTNGRGLTVFQNYDKDALRYTTSVNYSTMGVWNTTKAGNDFITDSQRLPGSAVYHGWEDSSGVVYLGTSNGLALLHPDGRVETVPDFEGRLVYSSFKTPEEDLYLNTDQGIEVWYADKTPGRLRSQPPSYPSQRVIYPGPNSEILPFWLDREGNLNAAIRGEGVEVYAATMQGTATSFPVDASSLSQPALRWEAARGERTVRLQSRTGAATSAYVNTFEDESRNSGVLAILDPVFARQQISGILTLTRTEEPFDAIAWLALPQVFPAGSTVQVHLRLRSDFHLPGDLVGIKMAFADPTGTQAQPTSILVRKDDWALLTPEVDRPFDRVGFSWRFIGGSPLDLDYLSVVSPEGWTDWQILPNPAGSPIPQVDKEHPLVQWRAIFERAALSAPLPSLSGVWIEEGSAVTAVEERDQALPQQTALHANFPNPFNSQTTIDYQLAAPAAVQLMIYNLAGQPVKRLTRGDQQAGFYRVVWDGIDDAGRPVGSGVYLYSLSADGYQQTRRLVVVK